MNTMFLNEIYVTNASLSINHSFTYSSKEYIEPYKRVKVLFASASTHGIVVDSKESDLSREEYEKQNGFKLNEIIEVIDENPVISDEQFELAKWLSKTTASPFVSCLNTMLPKTLKTSKKQIDPSKVSVLYKTGKISESSLTKKQQELYEKIYDGMPVSEARKISASITNKLIEYGVLELCEIEKNYHEKSTKSGNFLTLSEDQKKTFDTIIKSKKMVSLIFGVTGSGKTEIYLHLARKILSEGKQVLILVPEISLTPQMIQRVKERFDGVVFYHSELSDQERYEQYKRIVNNEANIVVGTRSSVFLPFSKLGLIIVDEEHDLSYKQDSTPCYSTKNVVFKRAITHSAKVVLASATPSLESYTRALRGDYELCVLSKRINNVFPQISIIDLNNEVKKGSSYILSNALKKDLDQCLKEGHQAIILLNRRGYSPVVKCSECSSTLMCSDCDIPLNYHKDSNTLKCHQCGKTYSFTNKCPKCSSHKLIFYGFGTKRVEEELNNLYPDKTIERMDRDSTVKKGSHELILNRFGKNEIDILIGTQMISKGLDFPNVTLVGVLNADAGLMHQDYNAAKTTFDLLMQASGRSGRSEYPGKVVIQAFNPEHYVLKSVVKQDYSYFYNIEMNYRQKAGYPPYQHMGTLQIKDMNFERLSKSAGVLFDIIGHSGLKSYNPVELPKTQKFHRIRFLVMEKDMRTLLEKLDSILLIYLKEKGLSTIRIDIDPLYLE